MINRKHGRKSRCPCREGMELNKEKITCTGKADKMGSTGDITAEACDSTAEFDVLEQNVKNTWEVDGQEKKQTIQKEMHGTKEE